MNKKQQSKLKATILTTLLLIITLFLNVQHCKAQCHIDDWTALKALYESTNHGRWYGFFANHNSPPNDCDLSLLDGIELDETGRVSCLKFAGDCSPPNLVISVPDNNFNGSLPPEIGKLKNLVVLDINHEEGLKGSIPKEIGNLKNLEFLNLTQNNLSGAIPPEIGEMTSLTYLFLQNVLDYSKTEQGNQLTGSIPPELGKLNNLKILNLRGNHLTGSIPPELGDLSNLSQMDLIYNPLTGNIPPELGKLSNSTEIRLIHNQLSGNIPPELSHLKLRLFNNYFLCEDFPSNLQQFNNVSFSPQLFKPLNYNDIKSNILDTLSEDRRLNIEIDFPFVTTGFTYQWFRNGPPRSPQNGELVSGATQPTLNFDFVKPSNAGRYTLEIKSENCLPDGSTFEMISEPIYVILKGYDLVGQPIDYTQLIVEYENKAAKALYEQEFFLDNGGIWADKCDCNRELHLYDFPNKDSSIEEAYIALNQKIASAKPRNEIDGGFNYKLNNISLNATFVQASAFRNSLLNFQSQNGDNNAYTVKYDYPVGNYSDEVQVYLLDSGLDESNFNEANSFLLANAPVDSCYNFSAPGYNFTTIVPNLKDNTETVDTDYQDCEGHGTFGFRSISEGLEEANNTKIVPLKIIEGATGGNLFDLICAMYHAIDHNADVINISAGYQGEPSGILANAIYEAKQKGIFVVTAAGNDSIDIDHVDVVPQYPAYYASQSHEIYEYNNLGELDKVLIPYDNLITVGAVNINNQLNEYSNYGEKSVTLAAPGENIFGHNHKGEEVIGTGTSLAAFLTTQVLAREIARDNSRTLNEIWDDFENRYLVSNSNLDTLTSTGKQINFNWAIAEVSGCTDSTACNYFPYATIDDGSCFPDFIDVSDANEKLIQANDSIISNQAIQPLDTVTYQAGQQIILENGFEVNKNSSFSADIECGD